MLLRDAGQGGLTTDEWNDACREIGLGKNRRSDLYDWRTALKGKEAVYEDPGRWFVS